MALVRAALLALDQGRARARASGWAGRVHLGLLAAAALLAALTALGLPLPGMLALQGRLLPVLAATAGLLLLGPLLRRIAPVWLREGPRALARSLEDDRGWKDAASTALEVEGAREAQPVAAYLVQQAAALVSAVPPEEAASGRRPGRWGPRALAALFAVALLLPGVSGRAGETGAGRGGELGPGWREVGGGGPEDADRWLRANGRLSVLHSDLSAPRATGLTALFRTARPLPVPYEGVLSLLWDDVERGNLGAVSAPAGARAQVEREVLLERVPGLGPHLTPGRHRARLRLAPSAGPFTLALLSEELEVDIPPPEGGGAGAGPKDQPQPEPPPPAPEPPPPPAPTPAPGEPPPPPPPSTRETAVTPLINPGETVRKEQAVVAVRAPDAGVEPPPDPLGAALKDVPRAVERAISAERVPPRERAFLERYFRTLERLVAPDGGR